MGKTVPESSLRMWLRGEILSILNRKVIPPPFMIWCDPKRVWRDLLTEAAEACAFELWADEQHELVLRERFVNTLRGPRVIWLPVAKTTIGYFKPFELQATEVREWTPARALAEYGVEIPGDQMAELEPLLPAHMKEWIDRPKSAWKELTVGTAKGTLVDDERVLEILAIPGEGFSKILEENRYAVFARRVVDDFGLPIPDQKDGNVWRRQALASLLCTDAAIKNPDNVPNEEGKIIATGQSRERALKLMDTWLKRIDLVDHFEELAFKADSITSLGQWAKGFDHLPEPLASPAAENALFLKQIETLTHFDKLEDLAKHLQGSETHYRKHAQGFWGSRAQAKVPWESLADLASVASLLLRNDGVEKKWKTLTEAFEWFAMSGWQVDYAGERLFRESTEAGNGSHDLSEIRLKLRRAYLRHLDRVNSAFSELLAHSNLDNANLPFAGEIIGQTLERVSSKDPVAVLVLDACRFDLGCRLCEALNTGESAQRATVQVARAPIPSITALGMAACLPGTKGKMRIEANQAPPLYWSVQVEGFGGNLAIAEQRRTWLKATLKVKDKAFLQVKDVLNPATPDAISAKNMGRILFVFGDEFDSHDGSLQITGAQDHVDRYAQAVRRLRDAGYPTVVIATDHGFFHWDPAPDERDFPKPEGDVRWDSRRAIVGYSLKSAAAIHFKVTDSDMDCCIPRSVASFKTYGGLDFFHGGATLQELVIPVVIAQWPKKAKKAPVVLKPLEQIVSLTQRVEITSSAQINLQGLVDENLLSRQVVVKVMDPTGSKVLFKTTSITVVPGGGALAVALTKVAGAEASMGAKLWVCVMDADDEEILDRHEVLLKVDLSEWD